MHKAQLNPCHLACRHAKLMNENFCTRVFRKKLFQKFLPDAPGVALGYYAGARENPKRTQMLGSACDTRALNVPSGGGPAENLRESSLGPKVGKSLRIADKVRGDQGSLSRYPHTKAPQGGPKRTRKRAVSASSQPSLRVASVLYPPTSYAVGGGATPTVPDVATSPGRRTPHERRTLRPGRLMPGRPSHEPATGSRELVQLRPVEVEVGLTPPGLVPVGDF